MTSLSPPTPSDAYCAELLACCDDADALYERTRDWHYSRVEVDKDELRALLGEREAHSATRAENERMRAVVDAVVEQLAAWDALPELREDGRNIMALGSGLTRIKEANAALQALLAALASKESNSE